MRMREREKYEKRASHVLIFASTSYLAVLGGLSCGATTSYIPETGISIDVIQKDIQHLVRRYKEDNSKGIPNEGRIILRTESASADVYTTDVISNILKAEGKGLFDSRTAVFGHLQQGGVPSPLDRIRATRLAVECIDWIEQAAACKEVDTVGCILPSVYTTRSDHACVIGIRGAQVVFSPVEELLKETDVKKRRGVNAWWMDVNKATKILAKYDTYAD